jgi:hypothetical protein
MPVKCAIILDYQPTHIRYCLKIKKKTKKSPEEQLRACDAGTFRAYIRWRKKHFRIKKESSMRTYWKRLCMCYRNLTGLRMNADVLDDICNVCFDLGMFIPYMAAH